MDDLALNLFKILGTGIAHAQNATSTTGGFTPISEGFNQVIGFVGPAAQISGGDFGQVVNGIYRLSIRIAGAVAVAMFVYGGIMYMTQPFGVSEGGVGKAKEKMQNAILGLLMLLATWVIFNQINPDILSLKVNAKPLEALKAAPQTGGSGTSTQSQNELGGQLGAPRILNDGSGQQVCPQYSSEGFPIGEVPC